MATTSTVTTPSAVKEFAKNEHIMSSLLILLDLYLQFLHKPDTYSTTPMAIEPLFHLRSNSTAQPFNILFSPDPTSCHNCPYTTIGVDINITGPPPTPKTYKPNDILNTITANADNNLHRHE
jgi:hypothetical protein